MFTGSIVLGSVMIAAIAAVKLRGDRSKEGENFNEPQEKQPLRLKPPPTLQPTPDLDLPPLLALDIPHN